MLSYMISCANRLTLAIINICDLEVKMSRGGCFGGDTRISKFIINDVEITIISIKHGEGGEIRRWLSASSEDSNSVFGQGCFISVISATK